MTAIIANPAIKLAPKITAKTGTAVFGSDGSREAANRIVAKRTMPNKMLDLAGVAADLKALAKSNPRLAQNSYAEIISRLKPLRQGELQRLVGKSLVSPAATQKKLGVGQHALRGTSIASDTLHGAVSRGVQSKAIKKLAPLPAKIVLMTVDAKLKYDELRAKGFSHGAANAGVIAGQLSGAGISGAGTAIGGWGGGVLTSWSGPGAILGAGGGALAGGAIAGGIDWAFGVSDKAALAAANQFDGKHIK